MAEVYFRFKEIAYLYDINQTKLFRIENKTLIEIKEPKVLQTIRFKSTEINENQASELAHKLVN